MILKKYLSRLKRKKIDTLIPGCTHYPFLQKDIERITGKNCRVLNGPEIVSGKLADYLSRHPEMEEKLSKNRTAFFCTTDDPERFKIFGQKFLCKTIARVERATLVPETKTGGRRAPPAENPPTDGSSKREKATDIAPRLLRGPSGAGSDPIADRNGRRTRRSAAP